MTAPNTISALRQKYGALGAYADIRLVTLGDGAERGVRVLELRTGGGLEAEIIVDRTFDIGRLALNGTTLSWHTPAGYRSAAHIDPHAEGGQGWLTGMSGFLGTCGFDHIRQPESEAALHAPLHPTKAIAYPLHGAGAHQPAKLIGYGIDEDADEPLLWATGEITQSMMLRGTLRLQRRIEAPLGGTSLTIRDKVRNIGPTPMPSMMLYHMNLGYPMVGAATVVSMDRATEVWRGNEHDPLSAMGPAPKGPVSELSVHRLASENGMAQCHIHNPQNGLALHISYSTDTLPYLQLLRVRGFGANLIGIEPCSTAARSRQAARAADEMPILEPGETRIFTVKIAADALTPRMEVTG
ncbi:DUF4432 family protein [Pseudorhodobacter sp.]|uniref:DUF4432 family protein n=1 Tax=Pseudorhodobacter sp. TaxID=1934400 RepID=UPI0026494D71|nr:DUF4432 family protein [Pseudorhodobacter sp.]MDN5787579.1 DUF4432 family protein [Pseudorhodobacter sp.]